MEQELALTLARLRERAQRLSERAARCNQATRERIARTAHLTTRCAAIFARVSESDRRNTPRKLP